MVDVAARFGIYTVVDTHDIDWSYTLGGDGAPALGHGSLPPPLRTGTAALGPPPAPAVVDGYAILWVNARWHEDGDWRR